MLHITLLILKILLFTVLILLGLAIVLLLLLMLVPFRYKVYADKHEKFVAKLKVSYMAESKGIYIGMACITGLRPSAEHLWTTDIR